MNPNLTVLSMKLIWLHVAYLISAYTFCESTSYQLLIAEALYLFLHNMKTSENEIVLTCYRNAIMNTRAPIGHNIEFLGNTFGIGIVNSENTPFTNSAQYY